MKKTTTAIRLKEIMSIRNLRQVDILNKCQPFCVKYHVRLGRNDLSQYVSGKVEPGQEKLSVLSYALDVNEAWLMGYDVPMERSYTPVYRFSSENFVASPEGKKLITTYLSLNEAGKKQLLIQCDLLLASEKYNSQNMPILFNQLSLFPSEYSEPYVDKNNLTPTETNLDAAHADVSASDEDKKHDEDIMNDDKKWGV